MASLSTVARRSMNKMNCSAAIRLVPNAPKRTFAGSAESSENLVKTALNELHKELGGDMVPFAGYELPVLYKGENGGVMKEHLWCRSEGKASLFDVSHMGQVSFPCLILFFWFSNRFVTNHLGILNHCIFLLYLYSPPRPLRFVGTERIASSFWRLSLWETLPALRKDTDV